MPFLLADGNARLPDGREVSRREADVWMKQNMADMQMAGSMQPANVPEKSDAAKDKKPMPGMTGMMM